MDRDSLLKILVLMSLLLLLSCDNSSSSSSGGGPVAGAPKLLSADPAINDSSAAVGLNITVTFDKAMNAGSAASFVVYGSQSGKLSGTYMGGGSPILAFDPDQDQGFKPGEQIEVILTGSLTATDGRSFWPFVYRFRAESQPATGRSSRIKPFQAWPAPLPLPAATGMGIMTSIWRLPSPAPIKLLYSTMMALETSLSARR